jgi:flavin reductase (DIM6/NTAB) family NADH-FMN oxidoreductase RutF
VSQKKKLGVVNCLYPMPVTVVGTLIGDRPNFMTVTQVGIMNYGRPPYISISSEKHNYSNDSIRRNGTFSVNIPTESQVEAVDYCGILSGRHLKTAPMIVECPLNMACRVHSVMDFETHDLFVGEIVQTYGSEAVLTYGYIEMTKVRPIVFDIFRKRYHALGEPLGTAWLVGRRFRL